MKLKNVHEDVARYLEEDCYCPGEIYDVTGFFFQVFEPEEECKLIAVGKSRNSAQSIICVICRNQIINFWIDCTTDKITSAERYDATENNIKQISDFLNGHTDTVTLNEFTEGQTAKSLAEILEYADAILMS